MYSRSAINRAGNVLAFPERYAEKDLAEAHKALAYWRGLHFHPINTFQSTLRGRLNRLNLSGLVAQRLKRNPSIIRKLRRARNMSLARMQDVGGLRAVLGTIPQVRTLERCYRNGVGRHELVGLDDYIDSPKTDGYRGIHLVYKYKNDKKASLNNLRLELQIRTRLQHFWATAVETVGAYRDEALKSGEGDERWRAFFRVAANALSHAEQAPPVPGYEDLTRFESLQLLREAESELSVLEKIRSFAIVTDQIVSVKRGKYFLVVLDPNQCTVSIKSYAAKEFDRANEAYSSLQLTPGYGHEFDCVLVSVDSIQALQQAYPNYFLDTHEFVYAIERLTAEAEQSRGNSYPNIKQASKSNKIRARRRRMEIQVASADIPQAEELYLVRKVIAAISHGSNSIERISNETELSRRHVNYRIAAARILSCITPSELKLTTKGEAWLRRAHGSAEETAFLRGLIENTNFFRALVPDLFEMPGPSRAKVAKLITEATGLSPTTAHRRALTLLTWAETIRQGTLALR